MINGIWQSLIPSTYRIDLYDGSGYQTPRQIIWSSGTLPYGVHNVTLMQIGPDARFGLVAFARSAPLASLANLHPTASIPISLPRLGLRPCQLAPVSAQGLGEMCSD